MKAAFYAGASGLVAQQRALNTIGNNIANANTNGYKAQGANFESLLYQDMYVNGADRPLNGVGVREQTVGIRFGQGALTATGFPLDFAVSGDAFFAVDRDGTLCYTRDGAFQISMEGERAYLTSSDGGYILNRQGERIEIPYSQSNGKIDSKALANQIGLFRFQNPYALDCISNTAYAATKQSGAAQMVTNESSKILEGFIEQSNISMVDEMASMISAQRLYQMSAKVIQTADENEQIISNLRK